MSEQTNKVRLVFRPYYREAIWYLHQPHSQLFKTMFLFAWLWGLSNAFIDLIKEQNRVYKRKRVRVDEIRSMYKFDISQEEYEVEKEISRLMHPR